VEGVISVARLISKYLCDIGIKGRQLAGSHPCASAAGDTFGVSPPRRSIRLTVKSTFRSLATYNYRVWAAGAIVSNIGTWMQRTAQDWIVLAELTHKSAASVGLVMALQFAPQLFLLPVTGYAADHIDRRRLLLATQGAMAALALGLGLLTVTGWVQLWHVYFFALMLGCVTAFDSPARQTFVSELVGDEVLSNAVALNSTSFNVARMIGPAAAGVLIASVGTGWVFLLNAASFAAVIGSLFLLRQGELFPRQRPEAEKRGLTGGVRYIARRDDLKTILLMFLLIGTFGLNFPIFISTMAVKEYHVGAGRYGLLTSIMAVGSVLGALFSAARTKPRIGFLFVGALFFGLGLAAAALMPNYWTFGLALVVVGMSAQTFTTTANGTVQMSTDANMRGRVMAILLAIAVGGTPIGAPLAGWVADRFGPRWAVGIGAMSGVVAALVGLRFLIKHHALSLSVQFRPFRVSWNGEPKVPADGDLPTRG